MFESVELGRRISSQDFKARIPELRARLITLQEALTHADFPVLLLITGDDNAGRADAVNLLCGWLDPRLVEVNGFDLPSDEERERPPYWRYWRALPPRGRTGIFFGSWYGAAINARLHKRMDDAEWHKALDRINRFERALVDDGALLIKLWIHLGKQALRRRVRALKKSRNTAWRVTERDLETYKNYDRGQRICERLLTETSTAHAPWTLIEGTDERYRDLTIATLLHDAVHRRLSDSAPDSVVSTVLPTVLNGHQGVLQTVDLGRRLARRPYRRRLRELQRDLAALHREAVQHGTSLLVVFEGWDAAGKGGCIRRLIHAMDARCYKVVRIASPSDEELAHHYLWRFWRQLPRRGHTRIFDRSWYGRVLVERVEGFANEAQWRRAYSEINDFEEQLVEHGSALVKFWLHIDADEQMRRFEARERTPWKQYKITEEDYRNRERWDDYVLAVNEMVQRTSTSVAPWSLISANDKRNARIEVLEQVCECLAQTAAN